MCGSGNQALCILVSKTVWILGNSPVGNAVLAVVLNTLTFLHCSDYGLYNAWAYCRLFSFAVEIYSWKIN